MSFAVRLVTAQTLRTESIEITKLASAPIWWPTLPGINVTGIPGAKRLKPGITSLPDEWGHQFPRIGQRLQSSDCRQ